MSWLQDLAWPWLLLALPLPWLVRRLLPPVATGAALRVPWADRLDTAAGVTGGRRGARGGLRLWLAAAAWACLCVAAARPQALGESVQPPQAGEHVRLFPGVGHMQLAHDEAVYEQIKQWCASA